MELKKSITINEPRDYVVGRELETLKLVNCIGILSAMKDEYIKVYVVTQH
jgi:hypothetical protein